MKRKLDVYTMQHYSVIEEPGTLLAHVFATVKDGHGTPYRAFNIASFTTFHMAFNFVKDLVEQWVDIDYITIVDNEEGE